MHIQVLDPTFRSTVDGYMRYLWGGPMCVTLGVLYDTSILPGFVAVDDGALLGVALYRMDGGACEVSALFSLVQNVGAGSKLLDAVAEVARREKAHRLWLVTTNDNTHAIRFYQKYGFALKAVHVGTFEKTRRLKGELPMRGNDGIPIEHEFEFEILL